MSELNQNNRNPENQEHSFDKIIVEVVKPVDIKTESINAECSESEDKIIVEVVKPVDIKKESINAECFESEDKIIVEVVKPVDIKKESINAECFESEDKIFVEAVKSVDIRTETIDADESGDMGENKKCHEQNNCHFNCLTLQRKFVGLRDAYKKRLEKDSNRTLWNNDQQMQDILGDDPPVIYLEAHEPSEFGKQLPEGSSAASDFPVLSNILKCPVSEHAFAPSTSLLPIAYPKNKQTGSSFLPRFKQELPQSKSPKELHNRSSSNPTLLPSKSSKLTTLLLPGFFKDLNTPDEHQSIDFEEETRLEEAPQESIQENKSYKTDMERYIEMKSQQHKEMIEMFEKHHEEKLQLNKELIQALKFRWRRSPYKRK